jgi:hypothetical protein
LNPQAIISQSTKSDFVGPGQKVYVFARDDFIIPTLLHNQPAHLAD